MKRIITILTAILVLVFSFSVCYAVDNLDNVKREIDVGYKDNANTATNGNITVIFNGEAIEFSQEPILQDGIILVPVREMCEAIGFVVRWNNSYNIIEIYNGDIVITLRMNSKNATTQDEHGYNKCELDVFPQVINNSTFVPVRFICEAIGAEITWDQLSKTVDIKYGTFFSVSIDNTVITLHDRVDSVLKTLGKPDRIDKDITKLDWYVYNKDYKKFIMVGMLNDKVASIYTSNTNFYINDEIKYGVKKEKLPELEQIQYEIDEVDGEILCGVMVSNKSIHEFWTPIEDLSARSEKIELQELDCLNAFRVHNSLNTLRIDEIAQKTARAHSKDMAENNYFSHTGVDGKQGNKRYYNNNGKKFACAENIVAGPDTGMIQFNVLLNSIGHRENMMLKCAKYVGIGVFYDKDSTYRYYGTQLFTY